MRTDEVTMSICGMDIPTVLKFKECFIRKYFKTEDAEAIQKYSSMIDVLRLIRAVFAIGFTSKNTAEFRPAIIAKAREVFFPNIRNIVGCVQYLTNTL